MTSEMTKLRFVETITRRQSRSALLASLLSAPVCAFALVGGAGQDPNTANTPWAGVGSLTIGGNIFSGTVIAPGYILTAAHVIAGQDPTNVTFQLNAGAAETFTSTQIFVNPAYTGTTAGNMPGDPTIHADLAIIKLASTPTFSLAGYELYAGQIKGQNLSFVSYAGNRSVKSTGENVADIVFRSPLDVAHTYLFDFDGPDLSTNQIGYDTAQYGTLGENREASFVPGDSGSAAFIQVDGRWQLAGINTFQATFMGGPTASGAFGTGGGGVVVGAYAPWIASVIAVPVPEPEPWLVLLSGMGLMGFVLRRRNGQFPPQIGTVLFSLTSTNSDQGKQAR